MLILRESIASIVLCFTCFVFSLFFFLFSTLNGNILVIYLYDVLFVFTEISEVLRKVLLQLNSFHAHLHFSSISFTNGTTLLFSFDLFENALWNCNNDYEELDGFGWDRISFMAMIEVSLEYQGRT